MENLGSIGIFFGGLGILLLSFGLFWFVDVYKKSKGSKQKEEK
jgi:multisubunit Na+/H+ antiporter MnhG subunit